MSAIVAIVVDRMLENPPCLIDLFKGVKLLLTRSVELRDRHYGKSDWNGKEFTVIDTGGYVIGSDDIFEKEIDQQVELAIDEADVIIFMVDVESGITGMDEDVAKLLRRVDKPVFVAVNKVDNSMREAEAVEFYALGLGDYYSLSSINGSGTGELLDALVEKLPEETEAENDLPRFAVVGRPNAGKSSFINALIGEDRYIVTDIAGHERCHRYQVQSFWF